MATAPWTMQSQTIAAQPPSSQPLAGRTNDEPQTWLVSRRRLERLTTNVWQHTHELPWHEYVLADFNDACIRCFRDGNLIRRIEFQNLPYGDAKYFGRSKKKGPVTVRRRVQLMDVMAILAWQPAGGFRIETQRAITVFGHDLGDGDSVKRAYSTLTRFTGIICRTGERLGITGKVTHAGSYNGLNSAYRLDWRPDAPPLLVRTVAMCDVELNRWRAELALNSPNWS